MEIVYPKYIFTPSPAFKLYTVVQKIWIGYYEVIGLSVVIYHDFRPANIYYQNQYWPKFTIIFGFDPIILAITQSS